MRGWQISDISKLSARGLKVNVAPIPKNRVIIPRQDCKEVIWMHWNLKVWCDENNLILKKEYEFLPDRKFRFDFCIPDVLKLGIEYDGLNSNKSGHTTLTGYTGDTEKFNLAVNAGWKVFRYTVLNYRNVLQDLDKLLINNKQENKVIEEIKDYMNDLDNYFKKKL